jgi:putative polyhydroxyalkanoate system protein
MADIHIERQHGMTLAQARKTAFKWAEQAEVKFGMECTYQEGSTIDEVIFKRPGVAGTLAVSKDAFELQAKLGFLLSAFKDKIESEIVKNLDALIATSGPGPKTATVAATKTTAKKLPPRKA